MGKLARPTPQRHRRTGFHCPTPPISPPLPLRPRTGRRTHTRNHRPEQPTTRGMDAPLRSKRRWPLHRANTPRSGSGGGRQRGGGGHNSRNPYADQPISESDRARHRQGDEQQAREMAAAQQRDNVEIAAHQATARDTRAGLALVPGQGSWPPRHTAPQLQEASSMI